MADNQAAVRVIAEQIAKTIKQQIENYNSVTIERKLSSLKINGSQILPYSIDGINLKDGSITTLKVHDFTAEVADIAVAQINVAIIDGAQIRDATIDNAKIHDLNADKITAGHIDTSRVSIYHDDDLSFIWNSYGLYAYAENPDGTLDTTTFVRVNKDGLMLQRQGFRECALDWDGFYLGVLDGSVEITADEGFVLYDGPNTIGDSPRNKLIQLGRFPTGSGTYEYGMRYFKTVNGVSVPTLLSDTNGDLWLREQLSVGDDSGSTGNIIIDGNEKSIGTSKYTSGKLGNGWKISGNGDAVFNNITARGTLSATVFEYDKISAVGGSLYVAPTLEMLEKCNITRTSGTTQYYQIAVKHGFSGTNHFSCGRNWLVGDIVSVQGFADYNANVYEIRDLRCKITAFTTNGCTLQSLQEADYVVLYDADTGTALNPGAVNLSGYKLVEGAILIFLGTVDGQGNLVRKGIYITANDANAPFIDVYDDTGTLNLKARMGNLSGIYDSDIQSTALSGYGLYGENVYLKGTIVANGGKIGGVSVANVAASVTSVYMEINSSNGVIKKDNADLSTVLTATMNRGNIFFTNEEYSQYTFSWLYSANGATGWTALTSAATRSVSVNITDAYYIKCIATLTGTSTSYTSNIIKIISFAESEPSYDIELSSDFTGICVDEDFYPIYQTNYVCDIAVLKGTEYLLSSNTAAEGTFKIVITSSTPSGLSNIYVTNNQTNTLSRIHFSTDTTHTLSDGDITFNVYLEGQTNVVAKRIGYAALQTGLKGDKGDTGDPGDDGIVYSTEFSNGEIVKFYNDTHWEYTPKTFLISAFQQVGDHSREQLLRSAYSVSAYISFTTGGTTYNNVNISNKVQNHSDNYSYKISFDEDSQTLPTGATNTLLKYCNVTQLVIQISVSSAVVCERQYNVLYGTPEDAAKFVVNPTKIAAAVSGTKLNFSSDGLDIFKGGLRIYDGTLTTSNKIFYVDTSGNLYVKGSIMNGSDMGGWSINSHTITSNAGAVGLGDGTSYSPAGNYSFWAGNSTPSSAPFSVKKDGTVVATLLTIGGSQITDGTITVAKMNSTAQQSLLSETISVYYRSTTNSTPTINSSTTIYNNDDIDNNWILNVPKPKNGRYFYTCERYKKADGTYSFSTVRTLSDLTVSSEWCSANDATYINGAHIYTGSITADQIQGRTITAGKIATNTITGTELASNISISTTGSITLSGTGDIVLNSMNWIRFNSGSSNDAVLIKPGGITLNSASISMVSGTMSITNSGTFSITSGKVEIYSADDNSYIMFGGTTSNPNFSLGIGGNIKAKSIQVEEFLVNSSTMNIPYISNNSLSKNFYVGTTEPQHGYDTLWFKPIQSPTPTPSTATTVTYTADVQGVSISGQSFSTTLALTSSDTLASGTSYSYEAQFRIYVYRGTGYCTNITIAIVNSGGTVLQTLFNGVPSNSRLGGSNKYTDGDYISFGWDTTPTHDNTARVTSVSTNYATGNTVYLKISGTFSYEGSFGYRFEYIGERLLLRCTSNGTASSSSSSSSSVQQCDVFYVP